jgi:serine/threonine-protein kinase
LCEPIAEDDRRLSRMASPAADRDLLFGLLALQIGFVDQERLVTAFRAWTRNKSRAMADHLADGGDFDADDRAAVAALLERHIKKHGGNTEKSLAAIPAARSTYASLSRIGDADVEGTLAHLGSAAAASQSAQDADLTASYSVGTATSDGQRFRLLRPHAKGGLGAVYVALDQELHREVALKQMLDHHADDLVSRQRFVLEAEITGGLEHPGIVPVYGLGTYADGRPYYAMRFIRGDSLKEAIERFHTDQAKKNDEGRRSLELRTLLRRFTDVCYAIEYAHSRGVLHRDIKPSNIVVGKHGETLVVDWGLAKPLGRTELAADSGERTLRPSSASGSASTLPGSALGTPAYMSPEQSEGILDQIGPRSDVYSLGATLYCLLTGKPPLEGDVADVIRNVQRGAFPPPRQFDSSIDRALEAVCLKAMALKPADRYGSPKALAEDVERWMADEPVTAWHEPWARVLLRWLTRHRVGVTAAGAAVLVALAGTAAVLAVQTSANSELRRANLDLGLANAKTTRANAELAASNERERARFALAQEAIRTFHTGVSEDVLLKQEEFKALRTKLLRGAREFYRKLEGLLQGQKDRDSRLALGRAYFEVGELTRQLDSIAEAEEIVRRALALFETLSGEDPANPEPRHALARCLKSLSMILTGVGRNDEALAAAERSRRLVRELAEADPSDRRLRREWAEGEMFYAMCLSGHDRSQEALEAIQRARTILEDPGAKAPPSEDPGLELSEVYGALALILEDAGRPDEALAAYKRSCDLGELLHQASPEDANAGHELARSLGNMAICFAGLGRHDEALAAFSRAREVLKAIQKANPTIVRIPAALAWIDTAAASVLVSRGRNDAALEALERARAAREVLIKANPAVTRNREQLIRVFRQSADIHRRAGRMAQVLESLERARDGAASLAGAHPANRVYSIDLATSCADLGEQHAAMGKPKEARSCLDQALAIARRVAESGPSEPSLQARVGDMLRRRGIGLLRLGEPADAVADFRESIRVLRDLKQPTNIDLYNIACALALLSGAAGEASSGLTPSDSRSSADAAMAALRQAIGAGWHDPALMKADPDLVPIHARPDFQLLLLDQEFPPHPFATAR